MNELMVGTLTWALIYGLHSTLLLGTVAVVQRWIRNPALAEFLWKSALVGALLTASLHFVIPRISAPATPLPSPATIPLSASTNPPTENLQGNPAAGIDLATPILQTTPSPVLPLLMDTNGYLFWFGVWMSLITLGSVRLIAQYLHLYRQLGQCIQVKDGVLVQQLSELCQQARIKPPVLSLTPTLMSPLLLPTGEICLPAAMVETMPNAEQRGVLAHEIAHKMRGDHYWLIFTQILIVIFPFQPLNRWAQQVLYQSSEQLSDQVAAQLLGSPLPLVNSLVRVATWLQAHHLPVMAMANRPATLSERVQQLLHPTHFPPLPYKRWLLALSAIGILLVTATPTIALALEPTPSKETLADPAKASLTPTPRATRTPINTAPIASTPTRRATPRVRPTQVAMPVAMWPVTGEVSVQPSTYHMAIDIAGEIGTPIVAAWDGTVFAAGYDTTGYGYRIILKHNDGYQTLYAHLENIMVELGDEVSSGDMIGTRGASGRVTGPTLHFEVRKNGTRVNPWNYLP